MKRREFVRSLGALGTVAAAGCNGTSSGSAAINGGDDTVSAETMVDAEGAIHDLFDAYGSVVRDYADAAEEQELIGHYLLGRSGSMAAWQTVDRLQETEDFDAIYVDHLPDDASVLTRVNESGRVLDADDYRELAGDEAYTADDQERIDTIITTARRQGTRFGGIRPAKDRSTAVENGELQAWQRELLYNAETVAEQYDPALIVADRGDVDIRFMVPDGLLSAARMTAEAARDGDDAYPAVADVVDNPYAVGTADGAFRGDDPIEFTMAGRLAYATPIHTETAAHLADRFDSTVAELDRLFADAERAPALDDTITAVRQELQKLDDAAPTYGHTGDGGGTGDGTYETPYQGYSFDVWQD